MELVGWAPIWAAIASSPRDITGIPRGSIQRTFNAFPDFENFELCPLAVIENIVRRFDVLRTFFCREEIL